MSRLVPCESYPCLDKWRLHESKILKNYWFTVHIRYLSTQGNFSCNPQCDGVSIATIQLSLINIWKDLLFFQNKIFFKNNS